MVCDLWLIAVNKRFILKKKQLVKVNIIFWIVTLASNVLELENAVLSEFLAGSRARNDQTTFWSQQK